MQTFLLAQAVLEHSMLSSVSTGIGDARYELQVFIEGIGVPHIVIGLGIVLLIMFLWRR